MGSQSDGDLVVLRKGVELCVLVSKACSSFPRSEIYGLADQMKRAAVLIPSNIAEGQARQGLPEFCHFLPVAKGSVAELDTQRIIAEELGFVSKDASAALGGRIIELGKMLYSLVARLKSSVRSAEPSQLGTPAINTKSKR